MVDSGIAIVSPQQRAWEHDRMERNVVLCHELIELDLVGILPPLSPLWCVARSDGEVAGVGCERERERKEEREREKEREGERVTIPSHVTLPSSHVTTETTHPMGASNQT